MCHEQGCKFMPNKRRIWAYGGCRSEPRTQDLSDISSPLYPPTSSKGICYCIKTRQCSLVASQTSSMASSAWTGKLLSLFICLVLVSETNKGFNCILSQNVIGLIEEMCSSLEQFPVCSDSFCHKSNHLD